MNHRHKFIFAQLEFLRSICQSDCKKPWNRLGLQSANLVPELNCWVLHPVACVFTTTFIKTTVRNKFFRAQFYCALLPEAC
jgi:hypothetical protein